MLDKAWKVEIETIGELEIGLEKALRYLKEASGLPEELEPLKALAPREFAPEVRLRDRGSGRRIRRSAPVEALKPDACEITITFASGNGLTEPMAEDDEVAEPEPETHRQPGFAPIRPVVGGEIDARLANLLDALEKAEQEPRLQFVALKWFRDDFLPKQGYQWTVDVAERGRVLRTATERGFVITGQVPNPRNPNFPTTTVRLNRRHPRVQDRLNRAPFQSREGNGGLFGSLPEEPEDEE